MINHLLSGLMKFIISIIENAGYLGIFGLLAAESAMVPITSLITLPFIGFLVGKGTFNILLAIISAAFGSLFGAVLSFSIGYFGKDTLARNIIKKFGKYLLISIDDLDKAERWFRKYGDKVIFFARLIPVVKMFISLPAGMAKMKPRKFILFTLLGSVAWASIMIYVGVLLGKNWNNIYTYYRRFEPIFIVLGVILVSLYIAHKIKKIRKNHA